MRRIAVIFGLALAAVMPVFAAVETTVYDSSYPITVRSEAPGVRIDWNRQAAYITTSEEAPIQSMGFVARDTAYQMALAAAHKRLETLFSTLHLTAYATVNEAVSTGYLPQETLEVVEKSLRPVVSSWDTESRTCQLTCALPLTGIGTVGELTAQMLKVEQEAFAKQANAPQHHPLNAKLSPSKKPVKQLSAGPYTGIILDCTRLHYTPTLLPKLVAKDGAELWGMRDVNPQAVQARGLVGFATTLKDATKSDRVGISPYIIRPLGTCGPAQGDLVLSDEDAKQLADLQASCDCLTNMSVVILLD